MSSTPVPHDPADSTRAFDAGRSALDSRQQTRALDLDSPHSTNVGEHTPTPLHQPLPLRYTLIGILGRGGMGEVLHAFDTSLHRQVALKYMRQQAATSPTARLRFMEEARILAQLDHPNVVKVFDRGEIDDRPYFAMAYLDGASLSERRGEFRTSAQRAVAVMIEVAAGVQHAHENGVFHRDLKAANVVFHDGRPVVTDFGCARWDDGEISTNGFALFGTASHMAPEVWLEGSKTSDARTDLWALGVMLYQLLAGELPFVVDPGTPDGRDQLLTADPSPIRDCPNATPGVDDRLEAIVRKALAKNPADRYATVAEFAGELEQWMTVEPTLTPAPRRWLVWGGMIAALTTCGVVSALTMWPKPTLVSRLKAEGSNVTFVADGGALSEHDGPLPGFVGTVSQSADGVLEIGTAKVYAHELFREPLPFPVMFEAEMAISTPQSQTVAGIYVGEKRHGYANGKGVHLAYFNVFGMGARSPTDRNEPLNNLAAAAVSKFAPHDGTSDADNYTAFAPMTTDWQKILPPDPIDRGGKPGPFHHLRIELSPTEIVAWRDGKQCNRLKPATSPLDRFLKLDGMVVNSPPLGSGFGLFVQTGAARFRNVRVTRLAERE